MGLRRANSWVYEVKLGEKRYSLPPGDLGWPFIGNMWSFLRAFKSTDPDSFISSFITRMKHFWVEENHMKGTKLSVVELIPDVEQGSSLQTAQVCLSKHGGHSHLSAKAISLRSWPKGMHCTICFYICSPSGPLSLCFMRFGQTGMYKVLMFGNPSIIVTIPEACRRVLTDDQNFKPGWPTSTMELIGRKSFIGITSEEHKRLRRLTATPVNGHEALSIYMQYIEDNVISALNKWAEMGEFEFLTALRKLTFKIIMYIFISSESEHVMEALERNILHSTMELGPWQSISRVLLTIKHSR
ncbi:Ent-kaurenoic acid oxidase 1 [Vitis vinifera]|uniref:Ent-kaurenoic acid oxidase 1 n=1 Tax=Vitis vinifera TaxID=29760 RepID=A0A438J008_VITVI|nr:Ent-kaurenoic acid oxidase 1 [Vitis vinifera]